MCRMLMPIFVNLQRARSMLFKGSLGKYDTGFRYSMGVSSAILAFFDPDLRTADSSTQKPDQRIRQHRDPSEHSLWGS